MILRRKVSFPSNRYGFKCNSVTMFYSGVEKAISPFYSIFLIYDLHLISQHFDCDDIDEANRVFRDYYHLAKHINECTKAEELTDI